MSATDSFVQCEHAERCGGCPVIGLSYEEQLALKRGRVVQSLGRYPSLELTYTEPVAPAEPAFGYRTRAKLIVGPKGEVGLFAKGGGHLVVDIPGCRVLSPVLSRLASALRERIQSAASKGGPLAPKDGEGAGALRAVDLRELSPETDGRPTALVTFVVRRLDAAGLEALRAEAVRLLAADLGVVGVAANFHDGEGPQVLGNETELLAGVALAKDRVGDSVHLATFGSFVQAHRGQARRVHQLLAHGLGLPVTGGAAPRILDLYAGSGAIGLMLARAGADVTMVEAFAPAARNAEAAAKEQGLRVSVHAADSATALRSLLERKSTFDAVVVNPPRRGVGPGAREALARLAPEIVAYVSCDPDTLARDLDHLLRLGYRTASVQPLDMIPMTDEVESVVLLRRTPLPRPAVRYEDDSAIVVEKGAHEPTTPQGEYRGSLQARLRLSPAAAEAAPVQRLDVGTSGLVLFAKSAEHVAAWQKVLAEESARRIYVTAVRGITPSKGTITRDLREDGRAVTARTRYRRLAVTAGHSILRVVPEEGRTHQVRRHLAAIGHPVLGDDRYGHAPTNRYFEEKHGLDRTFLHCVRLEVEHPSGGARIVVEAPLPGDLRMVLERSGGPGTLRFLDNKNALGGTSSLPPQPDSTHARGSAPDIDLRPAGELRQDPSGEESDADPHGS